MSLLDDANESLSVYGILDVSGDDPKLNLDINFKDFILDPIAPFGKGIVTNIRGEVSGYAVVSGRLQKPQINGSLKLNQGGLSIPYLNVDYEFKDNTTINLLEQSFIFNASQLIDSEFRSKGVLNGRLSHVNFYNWSLDLNIDSERLLVLNTEESEESLYFGTGFVDGNVHISGPMDQMFIEANVTTSEGTIFKIPISDNEVLSETSYMHFLSPEEKLEQEVGAAFVIDDVKGVEMEFNMDLNDNAEIEIILDKQTGSSILGRGNGSMLAQINTNGKFKMFGDFIVLSRYKKINI